jgi:1-acyl-sn-glycerol-3-phosphate acyltransferase
MEDGRYNFIVDVLDLLLWRGELVGEENLPSSGPAVLVANHHEALGPIAVACSIPLRLYAWVIADMVDEARAAAWLKWDFVERTLHLRPPVSGWFAGGLSRLTVPFMRSLGCIPVYKGDYERMADTLRLSMEVLRQGRFLLVFPEDNLLPADPLTGMRPFQRTFARLGELYHAETGKRLEFHPVTVHPSRVVLVGKPVAYDPLNPAGNERHRLKDLMEESIRATYLQVENGSGSEAAALTPQHK